MPDETQPAPPPQPKSLKEVESEKLVAFYSNYASVSASPEEFIFRFCQRDIENDETATEFVRIYVSFFHAKRLLFAMARTIKSYEGLFGEIPNEREPTAEGKRKLAEEATRKNKKLDANTK